ncbi:hypothetical protein N665_0886s0002 [Sinapis alba]|nr:hypothetical protein N665_0886s0002 [Sinapis alba]
MDEVSAKEAVTESTPQRDNVFSKETGWSVVSPGKACRSPDTAKQTLEYGQVAILSNSLFSVLSLAEEEGEIVEHEEQQEEIFSSKKTVEVIDETVVEPSLLVTEQASATETILPRRSLPRSSKSNHKFLSENYVQKIKDDDLMKKWVQNQDFLFGALLETRVKEGRSQRISSRIWLVWRPEINDKVFFYTVVYALNLESERKELWEDLKNHHNSPIIRKKTSIVVGGFNKILDMEEHSMYETNTIISQGMIDFQSVASHCAFSDLACNGPLYTWTNKRDEGLISKKLDRVLVNDHWTGLFPQSYNVFEGGGCSDHLRCRIHLHPKINRPKRYFKFVNAVAQLE